MSSLARILHMREKLLHYGAESLSDVELLAAFISSGSGKTSCLQIAQNLLYHVGDFRTLLNADFATFQQVAGVGVVRFVQLQAVREICRRSDWISLQKGPQLTDSQAVGVYLKRRLRDKKYETLVALYLDNHYCVVAYEELCTGSIHTVSIQPRMLIERSLKFNAAALILAHNHPSGECEASVEDISITEHLYTTLACVDIRLLDHLVIGDNQVYSIMSKTKLACH